MAMKHTRDVDTMTHVIAFSVIRRRGV